MPPSDLRCPGCGAQLSTPGPCLACDLVGSKGTPEARLQAVAGSLGEPLGLDLRPEQRERYERIRIRGPHDPRARTQAAGIVEAHWRRPAA